MKKLVLTALLVCIFVSPARAGEWFSWDKTNTNLHVPLTLLMFADYKQTLYNQKTYYRYNGFGANGEYHQEDNFILGKYPSRQAIHNYFAGTMISCTAIPFILPPPYSYAFQGSVITLEIDVVYGNYFIGAEIKF